MEFYQIRYFLAVSRLLNFTRAAEHCNVTQPALTRAMKKLEDELGGELFRRERKRSHLTDFGQLMLPLLQQSFDAAEAVKTEAESYGKGDVAPLRIGISETIVPDLLDAIIGQLQRSMAGIDLTLRRMPAPAVLEALQDGEIDFALTAYSGDFWERANIFPLFDEELVLCAAPTGNSGASVQSPAHLVLVRRPYCEQQDDLALRLLGSEVKAVERHRASNDADAAMMVRAGLGSGVFPRSIAVQNNLRICDRGELPRLTRTVSLVSVAGRRLSRAASGLLRLARAADWTPHAS